MKTGNSSFYLWICLLGLALFASSCKSDKYVFTQIGGPASVGLMRSQDSLFVQVRAEGLSESEAQTMALHLADSTFKAEVIKEFDSIIELSKQEFSSSQDISATSRIALTSTIECIQNVTEINLPSQVVRIRSDYDYENNSYTTYALIGVDTASINALFIKCMFRKDKLYSIFKTTEAFKKLNRLFPPRQ